VDLFDKLLANTNAKARSRLAEYHQAVATAANDKVLLLAQIVRVLLDPDLDEDLQPCRTHLANSGADHLWRAIDVHVDRRGPHRRWSLILTT
jgi:hypothetical protein